VTFRDVDKTFVVSNRYYTASLNKQTGELYSVLDRLGGRPAITGDKLIVRVSGRADSLAPADFSGARFSIEDGFDFYVRVLWTDSVSGGGTDYRVERTYEFTNSPNIYEQVAILNGARSGARNPSLTLEEFTWEFQRGSDSFPVRRTADDLWTELPLGLLGGNQLTLSGHAFATNFDSNATNPRRRIVVSRHVQNRSSTLADLGSGHGLISASVVSLLDRFPDQAAFSQPQFAFYPGYGLRQNSSDSSLSFINWNHYELSNWLIPLRRKYEAQPTATDWLQEDMLIRITMHLVDRMKLDGGWPRWPAWSSAGVSYPMGGNLAPHSRAFPAIAYLWSYLTVEWEGGRWVHSPGDADVIYNQLQHLRRFYGVAPDTASVNFKDRHEGVYYIGYSTNRKEMLGNGPRGVLNAHAHALHFAWIMRDASELRGLAEDAKKWQAIVEFYHPGSKMLYQLLYPGAKDCPTVADARGRRTTHCNLLSGHLAYSLNNPCIYPGCDEPGAHPSYSFISHEGIAAGYLDAGEYEPEFVDAVERASRLDYNPYGKLSPLPLGPLVARLCRTLPLALAFTGDNFSMAIPDREPQEPGQPMRYDISATSLKEVSSFARLRFRDLAVTRRAHDPQKAIAEYGEQGLRKVVWSNRTFVTDWIPGFWEEMNPDQIPPTLQYRVDVRRPGGGQPGNWAAYRIGNRVEVMGDFDEGVAVLKLPPTSSESWYLMGYRDYDPNTLRWKAALNDTWHQVPKSDSLVLPRLAKKRLVFVYFRPR